MKLNLLRNCIFCLVSLSGTGQAPSKDIVTEVYVNSIYSAIRQEWTVLENVCDTHVHRKLRLIVTDNHNAWAIDSKSLTKLPYREKQRHLPLEYMHCMKIQGSGGRSTISASLEATLPPKKNAHFQTETKPVPALFNVATHEDFHFFAPTNVWKKTSPDNDSQATPYPAQASPRFYLSNIIRPLYTSLRGEQNGLDHVRFWFNQRKKLYPDDASHIRKTDIYEGGAWYVEIDAKIIAEGKRFNTSEF